MYSSAIDGKVLDWTFNRGPTELNMYNFYVGEVLYGQIFKMQRQSWTAVCLIVRFGFPVGGFNSRLDAAKFIIDVERFKKEQQ